MTEPSDAEIEALMAELEDESAKIVQAEAVKVVAKAPPAPKPKAEMPPAKLKPIAAVAVSVPVEEDLPFESTVEPVAHKPDPVVAEVIKANEASITPPNERVEENKPVTNLQHYVDAAQFQADTRVTEAGLDACMIEQNGLRAYYGTMAARAEAQADRLKARFDVIEATLNSFHRKAFAEAGEKCTEKMVENAMLIDARWLAAKNLVIEADAIASINKALVESLKDRRDMIIQLGADRRDEYKGAARVLEDRTERSELAERAAGAMKRALGS